LQFFNTVTDGCKPQTERVRISQLTSYFNFVRSGQDDDDSKLHGLYV
jgi:hypothetical protein